MLRCLRYMHTHASMGSRSSLYVFSIGSIRIINLHIIFGFDCLAMIPFTDSMFEKIDWGCLLAFFLSLCFQLQVAQGSREVTINLYRLLGLGPMRRLCPNCMTHRAPFALNGLGWTCKRGGDQPITRFGETRSWDVALTCSDGVDYLAARSMITQRCGWRLTDTAADRSVLQMFCFSIQNPLAFF